MRSFNSALERGHWAERAWVDTVRSFGRCAAHGKKLVIKNHDKRTGHTDAPDATVMVSLEIKERSFAFTCPEDFPFGSVYVDDLRGLSMERMKHLAYVYLSKPTGQWVWLCALDRDERWKEEVTYDRARGHEVPVLTAPKSHLRPAAQLMELIYPHTFLELVDGDAGLFVQGGGEVEERDRYVAVTHPDFGGRDRSAAGKTH